MEIPEYLKELWADKTVMLKSAMEGMNSDIRHYYPWGCTPLDIVFGGGMPSGKVVEIFGWEGSGKSTLGLLAAFSFIDYWVKRDRKFGVVWIETEMVFNKVRAQYISPDKLGYIGVREAETIEEGDALITNALLRAVEKNMVLFFVWDTIAATATKAEKTGAASYGAAHKAMLIRSMLRKVTPLLSKTDSTLLLINQMSGSTDGGDASSPGGRGIKFHASIRASLTERNKIAEVLPTGLDAIKGIRTELFTHKSKVTNQNQSVLLHINGEKGLDIMETNFHYIKLKKILGQSGSWFNISLPTKLYSEYPLEPKMEIPFVYVDKNSTGWTMLSFQNLFTLKEKSLTFPHIFDWIDYKIYESYSKESPLIKIKIITKIWEYEIKFFGKPVTVLNKEELEAAKIEFKNIANPEEESGTSKNV